MQGGGYGGEGTDRTAVSGLKRARGARGYRASENLSGNGFGDSGCVSGKGWS